ncbi:hypothetical protein DXG01_014069, partial [Tephrocybe rancida]
MHARPLLTDCPLTARLPSATSAPNTQHNGDMHPRPPPTMRLTKRPTPRQRHDRNTHPHVPTARPPPCQRQHPTQQRHAPPPTAHHAPHRAPTPAHRPPRASPSAQRRNPQHNNDTHPAHRSPAACPPLTAPPTDHPLHAPVTLPTARDPDRRHVPAPIARPRIGGGGG